MTDKPRISENLQDIQGNTVRGYAPLKVPAAAFMFVDFGEQPSQLIRRLLQGFDHVTNTKGRTPALTLNIAFTHRGLERAGIATPLLDRFSTAFVQGMAKRADLL